MALANVNIGTERFIDWINRTNQIIQLVNFEESTGYHSNGNIAINGTSTVNGASKFGEANATGNLVVQKAVTVKAGDGQTIAINVAAGLIKGDGGLLTNVRSANLTQNTINVQSNTGTITFSTGNPALGGQVFLDVRTSQLLSDQSNSNVASALTANGLDIHIKTVHAQVNTVLNTDLPNKQNINSRLTFISTATFSNGDLIGANSSGLTVIPRGSNGQILTAQGENLQWIDLEPQKVTKLSDEDLLPLYLAYIVTTDETLSQGIATGFNSAAGVSTAGNTGNAVLSSKTWGHTTASPASETSTVNIVMRANNDVMGMFTGYNTRPSVISIGNITTTVTSANSLHGDGHPHWTFGKAVPDYYNYWMPINNKSSNVTAGSVSNTYNAMVCDLMTDRNRNPVPIYRSLEANTTLPVTIRIDYSTPTTMRGYDFQMGVQHNQGTSVPKDFQIEGSNNDSTWITVVSVVNNNTYTPLSNSVNKNPATFTPTNYRYWRLVITRNGNGNTTIANSTSGSVDGAVPVSEFNMIREQEEYPFIAYGFGLHGYNNDYDAPRGFIWQASNDYVSWSNVFVNSNTSNGGFAYGKGTPYDVLVGSSSEGFLYRPFENPAAYKYYRLLWTEYPRNSSASGNVIASIFLSSVDYPTTGRVTKYSVISDAYTTDSPPDYISGIVTIDKDKSLPVANLSFAVSRNNGNTWANISTGLTEASDHSDLNAYEFRFTNQNLMSHPSGTSVKWRFDFDRVFRYFGSDRTSINSVILAWGTA